MITKVVLAEITSDQQQSFLTKEWIKRRVSIPESTKRIVIVSGVRRCGKSTLIKDHFLIKSDSIYINFEDPRLVNFELSDFNRLEELLKEQGKKYLLLDEVQNISKWELYARSANERGIPIIITGSNASLLSRELGTKLTGRYNQLELFPFSFDEFLKFFKLERTGESFKKYFELGGFPEFLEEKDTNYLRLLLRDIVSRDIALRRHITNENQLMRLVVHLFSNIGKDFSFNKLSKLLEIKSVRTVIDYCDYLKESYLVDYIPIYSLSIKRQIANPKKVYAIDPVFAKANSLSFSRDLGRRLENFVYLKLRYSGNEIFYYRNEKRECDFLVKENELITKAVQVCWEVTNDNFEREIEGLRAAKKEIGVGDGVIITFNQEEELDGVRLIPVWKWL